jgi:hypothetical protein
MSIIRNAIRHSDCRGGAAGNHHDSAKLNSTGCYGIDALFAKKSCKLSFAEFCDAMKGIFLTITIFLIKAIAAIFSFAKRPICAFSILCALPLIFIASTFGRSSTGPAEKVAKNVVAVQNISAVGLQQPIPKIVSNIGEHAAEGRKITGARENSGEIGRVKFNKSGKQLAAVKQTKSSNKFMNTLRDFFAEHEVSDVMCLSGCCRLKLKDGIFAEHTTICNNPKIILESSTDSEIVFSDGMGNFCTLAIESLLP